MNKYRAAIVGCGRIASDFDSDPKRKDSIATHAGAYKNNKDIELVAASDIDQKKLKIFGEKWLVSNLYSDFNKMFDEQSIDILSICTWSSSHLEVCKKAVSAKVKAIFCEKPITESLKDADEMVSLCKDNGVVLAVNHSRRWDKMHQDIKKYIDEGKLGEIQTVSAFYTAGIINTGTHLLDILRYFFGDVAWIRSDFAGKTSEADPSIDAYLYFKKGFGVALHGLNVKDYLIFEIDIYGSKGRIRIENSGYSASIWDVIEHPKFTGYKCLGERKQFSADGLNNTMVNSVADLLGCIKSRGIPRSTGQDGTSALELICAIHESGKIKSGEKVLLPLKNREVVINSK